MMHLSPRGAVSYLLVALLAALAGAAAMWLKTRPAPRPLVADSVTTHGEWVKIKRGSETIRAYVAYPERKTKAPAVMVIHEIFGLTDWEPTVADRLAKEGAEVEVTPCEMDPFLAAVKQVAKPRPAWPADYALNHGHYVSGEPKKP